MVPEKAVRDGSRHAYVSTAPVVKRGKIATAIVTTIFLVLLYRDVFTTAAPSSWRTGNSSPGVLGHYPYKPSQKSQESPSPKDQSANAEPIDRLIVKVRLEHEDDSWLDSFAWREEYLTLSSDASNMYAGGKSVDKGRIAEAYLRWIIENYNNLPETIVFLRPSHPSQKNCHNKPIPSTSSSGSTVPPPLATNIDLSTLRIPSIQRTGFANLHCPSTAKCADAFHAPSHHFRTLDSSMRAAWDGIFGSTAPFPDKLAAPLVSEFAVSAGQVRRRSADDYLRIWDWLSTTRMDDETAGRVVEAVWHVVFGMGAEFCVDERECKCHVYGRCE